ncbi:uncharacterized protein TNCV_2075001 [Trichonephila clavipes]|nr:uncharacterized protein TNCV_2075001 [Trichonephila clavipes]
MKVCRMKINSSICYRPSSQIQRRLELSRRENYPNAIAQLQERFGREDLLVQIYVRDLLSLLMRDAATGRSKTDLPALYDEQEVKIRALESLGRTQDKYSEFFSPLVESCLPEDILLAFERSKNFKEDSPGEGRTLKLLMNFFKQEVKNDEMVELARNNFSAPVNQKKKEVNKPDKFPSEATLVIEDFKNSMKILPNGRYELCLPFKSEAIDLSSNKDLTWKRHKKMCERAQRNEILDDYKVAFKEWEELEIIKKLKRKR